MSHYKQVSQAPQYRYSPVAAVKMFGDLWARLSPAVLLTMRTEEALRSSNCGPEYHDFLCMLGCERGMLSRA